MASMCSHGDEMIHFAAAMIVLPSLEAAIPDAQLRQQIMSTAYTEHRKDTREQYAETPQVQMAWLFDTIHTVTELFRAQRA